MGSRLLQFVQVVVQGWDTFLETLAFACVGDNNTRLACSVHWVSREDLPMVEHTLGEGLATSVGTKVSCETWKWTNVSLLLSQAQESQDVKVQQPQMWK